MGLFIATKPSQARWDCSNGKTYVKLILEFRIQLTDVMEDLQRIGMTYRKQRLLRGGVTNPLRDPLLLTYVVAGAALFLWGIATTLT